MIFQAPDAPFSAFELTEADQEMVSGGLNPQPLPPGFRLESPEPYPWRPVLGPQHFM